MSGESLGLLVNFDIFMLKDGNSTIAVQQIIQHQKETLFYYGFCALVMGSSCSPNNIII
jgi:hypothetical protein